jgi:glycosyltransferase involved in cell wall biosynthesis
MEKSTQSPQKKKLFLVITKSNWGGAQRYVYDLATGLSSEEYDITVLMGGDGTLKKRLDEAGIKTISIPSLIRDISLTSDIKTAFYLYTIFKKEKPHVVHLNSSKIGALGAFVGRLARVPHIVFTLHGLATNENRSFISKSLIRFIYWLTILWSHATISVSEGLLKQSQKLFPFVHKKIHVVYNGIKNPYFLTREIARARLADICEVSSQSFSLPVIGTIGELHHIKGHNYLIDAYKLLLQKLSNTPSIVPSLLIMGGGEERAHLEKKIRDMNLEGKVFLCGNVPQAASYLKALDIFVLSSLSEGLAYVIQEAGQAALPVVATAVGGIPEMIVHEETGLLVPPRDPEALCDALFTMIRTPEKQNKLSFNLHEKITGEFSFEQMIKNTEKFY